MKKITTLALFGLLAGTAFAYDPATATSDVINYTFDDPGVTLKTEGGLSAPDSFRKWSMYSQDDTNAKGEIIPSGDISHDNVAQFTMAGAVSWYKAFLYQDISSLTPQKYQLSFDVKRISGTNPVSVFFYLLGDGKTNYAVIDGFNATATPGKSGARVDVTPAAEWKTVTYDFDFTQSINNINSLNGFKTLEVTPINEDQLKKVRLCFNSFGKANNAFQIDNVKLVGKSISTGVDNVAVEGDAVAEYYTLDGVRVEAPAAGLYIKRQGSKASKVYIR